MSSRLRTFGRDWLPPVLWSIATLLASGSQFSAINSGHWLRLIIARLLGHELEPTLFDAIHHALRKVGHVTAYGVLSLLWFRALRGESRSPWMLRWAAGAVALAAVIASADEWHQSFVASRTGAIGDVFIDAGGAILAQGILRIAQVLLLFTA